jgi:ribonuclease T1
MAGRLQKLRLAISTAAAAAVFALASPSSAGRGTASIEAAQLPPEAQVVQRSIRTGGPFPYAKDGSVFGNRERLLPRERRGYYREYTVRTPGARDRGARRIVCGGERPAAPEACYYTDDHYASFRRIAP